MKTIQFFSDEYLTQCRQLSVEQVVRYLDNFRQINKPVAKPKTKLISMKIELDLLEAFKTRARLDGVPYQSRIKQIMRDWLEAQ